MRTIAIINQKGGCGKTTTSINLAACLARLGEKTLLVDMDPQGHCAVGLAVPEAQIEKTVYDALIEPSDGKPMRLAETVWQIASDFDLAPANLKLAAFEQVFAGRPGREDRLVRALETVRGQYKWCIIDCPPSVGLITFNALRAADEVIVPVETGFFSLHGLTRMMQTLDHLREQTGRSVQIRILPTLYDTRTKLAREVLSEMRSRFKGQMMESTVNFNTKLKEAASFGQPITEYDPGSRGYKDFVNLARELMGHRPIDIDEPGEEPLSRPAELVQRAKQLAQLTNLQFGRHTVSTALLDQSVANNFDSGDFAGEDLRDQPRSPAADLPDLTASTLATPDLSGVAVTVAAPAAPINRIAALEAKGDHHLDIRTAPAPLAETTAAAEAWSAEPMTASHRQESLSADAPEAEPTQARALTTEQKIEEIYGARQIGHDVLFAGRFDSAGKVQLAGDFNGWSPVATPLNRDEQGVWSTRLPLGPGRYRYRLVVDGNWITDPNNSYVESNNFGELNNVIEVD